MSMCLMFFFEYFYTNCKLSCQLFPLVDEIPHRHDVVLVRNQIISTTESELHAIGRSLSTFDPFALIEAHKVRTAFNAHWLRGWIGQVEPLPNANTNLCT